MSIFLQPRRWLTSPIGKGLKQVNSGYPGMESLFFANSLDMAIRIANVEIYEEKRHITRRCVDNTMKIVMLESRRS
jgi:hypothetical protein